MNLFTSEYEAYLFGEISAIDFALRTGYVEDIQDEKGYVECKRSVEELLTVRNFLESKLFDTIIE
jgi:hypothetical protein